MCRVLQVLASLAGSDPDLLHWHLMRQHGRALKLCIEVLGEDPGVYQRALGKCSISSNCPVWQACESLLPE